MTDNAPMTVQRCQTVGQLLTSPAAKQSMREVASKEFSIDRLLKLTTTAIADAPDLAKCDPMSMYRALMQCSQCNIEPNTFRGHAYLIPFAGKVQFILGYKGMLELARRHPAVTYIHADEIREDDEFSYSYGTDRHLKHKPARTRSRLVGAYCYAEVNNVPIFRVMWEDEILEIRDKSQGWKQAKARGKTDRSPWTTHPGRMYRKTAVRGLANGGDLPMRSEFEDAIQADYETVSEDFGAAIIDDGDHLIEPADPVEQDEPPAPQKTATPTQDGKEALKAAGEALKAKAAEKPKPTVAEQSALLHRPAGPDYSSTIASILQDAADGGVDAALNFHAEAVSEIEAKAPKQHAEFMEDVARYREAEAGDA